ncbi:cation:proton antiporter [Streptomyces sp. NPDC058735]|uniref:cation:proton antiporter n=1 Tax=unclassified Streptomyces TaxID=2593676 RepID=UPI00369A0D98
MVLVTSAIDAVAPLPARTLLLFLLQTGVLLALVLGGLARRTGLPGIVGELAAGVVLGPSLLGLLAPGVSAWLLPRDAAQMHLLDAVGQLGVLLLVGFTGMHVDPGLVRRHGRTAAGISAGALLIPLALGLGLGPALPDRLKPTAVSGEAFALFVGVTLCVSSIPVVGRILSDMNLTHRTVGQLILVVATVDDTVGWLLVSIVTAFATTGVVAQDVATSVWHLCVVLLVTLTVGRWAVRWIMRRAGRSASSGAPVTAAVVLLVLAGAGTQALGFEALLGAFLCGILIGSSPADQVRLLKPLDTTVLSFLSPLFFALAGLRIDLGALAHPTTAQWALIALGTAVIGKFLGALVGNVWGTLSLPEAVAVGAGINARGVVQIVIAVIGMRLGLLNPAMYSIVVLIAVITPAMAPLILKAAMKRVEQTEEETAHERRDLSLRSDTDTSTHGRA